MKRKIKNIIFISASVSTVIVCALVFVLWNFIPFSWLDKITLPRARNFGATITTIQATDKISDSRAVINTNFTNLNNDKIEVSTTTLPNITTLLNLASVGTLTTGTWNASTLTVSYGGTGSTTLAKYQVLLGSSTDAVTMVDGFGTSGQFLTSNGADTKPSWQSASFDTALNYHLTGDWNFTSNVYTKNLFASSTAANPLNLNGLNYTLPDAYNTATNTVMKTDGSGSLSFGFQDWETIEASSTSQVVLYATTTIPTGFREIRIIANLQGFGSAVLPSLLINGDPETTLYRTRGLQNGVDYARTGDSGVIFNNVATSSSMFATFDIVNVSTLRKVINFQTMAYDTGVQISSITNGSGIYNDTTNEISSLVFYAGGATIAANSTFLVQGRR